MYGLVFVEALSYGLPVIAPRHTAIPEAVDSQSAILYQPGNLDECVAAIRKVVDSQEYWKALSEGAKAFMEYRYAQDYYGQYAQVLLQAAGIAVYHTASPSDKLGAT